MTRVIVVGATSLIGHFLLPVLASRGYRITAVSRNAGGDASAGIRWIQHDISKQPLAFGGDETLISLAPIWILGKMLQKSEAVPGRVIAFSSTSAISKANSSSPAERNTAEMLLEGETAVRHCAEDRGMGWTILRPTMVYGAGLDQNVSVIARFIERYRFFPLLGTAHGKRSPVHAADLADAVVSCMLQQKTTNQLYALSGGDVLAYHEMVARIFIALGYRQHTLRIPTPLARGAIRLAALLPHYASLQPSMADRTNQDLIFDSGNAIQDFGYAPRAFRPEREDLVRDTERD